MSTTEVVRGKVRTEGLAAVARRLKACRKTVAYWLAGASTEGTAHLLEQRAREAYGIGQEGQQ